MTRPREGAEARGPVVHVVAAGEVGGAERMLVRLAGGEGAPRRHIVALWTDDAAVRSLFQEAGLTVVSPPQRRGAALTSRLRTTGQPDVAWLAAYLTSAGAAAVQLHTFASHMLGTRAGLRARVPVVRTEHSRRVYDNWACRPFSSWSLRRAAHVVAVSEDLRRLVAERFPSLADRLTVIHNGVGLGPRTAASSPPRQSAVDGDGPIRFVLAARLEPRKAIDRALRAIARVPEARLDVVGDGPLRGDLEALAATLGLGERVRFWGYRADPEVVVAQADVAICSSLAEGLPLGLLEAMALERPVVSVPVGGVPELVTDGETGWLAAAASEEALTAAVLAAVTAGRPELRRRGDRARDAVERSFSAESMRQAYEDVYASLAASGAASPP